MSFGVLKLNPFNNHKLRDTIFMILFTECQHWFTKWPGVVEQALSALFGHDWLTGPSNFTSWLHFKIWFSSTSWNHKTLK